MQRFLAWIREWRGLQARLWLAHEELLQTRERMLKAEETEKTVRQKSVQIEIENSELRERELQLQALLRRVESMFSTKRALDAGEIHTLLIDIKTQLDGRKRFIRW